MLQRTRTGVGQAEGRWRRSGMALGLLLLTGWALLWNGAFLRHWSLREMLSLTGTPDARSILTGYHQAPHPLTDGLRWWHGPFIQVNVAAFRPLASYLYWADCWVGLHAGFVWDGWIGLALFVANCALGVALAWRLTRSRACVLLAAGLAPLATLFNPGQPDYWLVWFPVHQDLLMSALLLGGLLCFDLWGGRRGCRLLAVSWALFLAASLTKEHAYIFPALAAATALLRRPGGQVRAWNGPRQAGLMLLAVGLLCVYRAAVIPHPRNPLWRPVPEIKNLFVFQYSVLVRYLLTGDAWLPGLALLLLALALGAAALARAGFWRTARGARLARARVWLPMLALAVSLYCASTVSLSYAFWYFLDPGGVEHGASLRVMVVMLYSMFLLWKYRREEPTAAAWWWLLLSYVPVVNFLGWHYALPAWFVRVPYTALIVKLAWLDCGLPRLGMTSAVRLIPPQGGRTPVRKPPPPPGGAAAPPVEGVPE